MKKIKTLISGIYSYNIGKYFYILSPTDLQINITYNCNSRCLMCHIWKMRPQNELEFNKWQKIMADPIFKNIQRLLIAGGEPFLHPELTKLVGLFLNSMPKLQSLSLVTNGLLSKKIVSEVKLIAGLCQEKEIKFSVAVSLDGIGEVHNKLRGIPFAFEKTSKTIMELKGFQKTHNLKIEATCLVCHQNLRQLGKLEEWCREKEIPLNYQLIGFHKTYVQNLEKQPELDFKQEDRPYLTKLLQKWSNSGSWKNPKSLLYAYFWQDMINLYRGGKRTTPCPFAFDAFVLDSFGDVYYCLSEPKIGNCRQDGNVSRIYYNKKNLDLRKKRLKTVCLKCNSACFAASAVAKDFQKFFRFYLKRCLQ